MKRKYYNNPLRESLRRGLENQYQRQYVREAVAKAVREYIRESYLLNEDESISVKRKRVMSLLQDPKYNHAQIAYAIWHPENDSQKATYRSLFTKCANGTPEEDGTVREFSDDDIVAIDKELRKK